MSGVVVNVAALQRKVCRLSVSRSQAVCPWLRKLNAAKRKRQAPRVTIGTLIGRSSKPPTTTATMASRRACSTQHGKDSNRGGRSGPRGTIAAGEFLIDPAHLAQVSPGHPSPGKKNKNYGVRAKPRDHRRTSWHTQAGTPKMAHPRWKPARVWLCSQGFAPIPGSAARAAGQVRSCLQP